MIVNTDAHVVLPSNLSEREGCVYISLWQNHYRGSHGWLKNHKFLKCTLIDADSACIQLYEAQQVTRPWSCDFVILTCQ